MTGSAFKAGLDYAVLFNATTNGMAFTEYDSGRILDVNEAWVRATGIPREQSIGRSASELGLWVYPGDRSACLEQLEGYGRVTDFEATLCLQQEKRPHLISGQFVEMGGVRCVLWEFRDIATQKRMQEALHESEILRNRVFGASRVPIVVMDAATHKYLECNDAVARIYQVDSREAVLGRKPMDFSAMVQYDGTPSPEKAMHFIGKALAEGAVVFEWRHQRSSGELWDAEVHLMSFRSGEQTLLQFTLQDITERKRTEVALRLSEEKFKRAFLGCPEAMSIASLEDGKYLDVNDVFLETTGFRKDEVVGRTSTELGVWVSAEDRNRYIDALKATGVLRGFETRYRMHSGEIRDFLVSSETIEVEGKACSLNFILDITQAKAAQTQIRRLNEDLELRVKDRTAQLEGAIRELESFSYSVSHDLRSPLRGIDGFSQILLKEYSDRLDEEGRHCLTRIRRGVQRMGQIIDDLLKLSGINRSELEPDEIDLSGLCEKILEDLQRGHPDTMTRFEVQPGMRLHADPRMLLIALENLLGNAWKFTSKREGGFILAGEQVPAAGDRIFFIRDNGAGFDMAFAAKLFLPFQRLHDVEEFDGTGIGLAIVHRIVRRHGGNIWAEGRKGEGATFYFQLPEVGPGQEAPLA